MSGAKTTRRDLLSSGAGLGILSAALLVAPPLPAKPRIPKHAALDLDDPQQRFAAEIKMRGSLADEPVHTFVRLHIWGFANDGNLVPFFSMNNYAVNVWRKLPSGNHVVRVFETGVYTRFDSYDVITEWDNPLTGERREVQQFRSGPFELELGPEGIAPGGQGLLKPQPMRPEVIEDSVIISTQAAMKFPTAFPPDQYPKESAGPIVFWDSHYTHVSPLAAVADKNVASAPATIILNNLVSWAPWLAMSQRPGRTYGRGAGCKVSGPEALPAAVLKSLEQHTPQVLDIANWGPRVNDVLDYRAKVDAARAKQPH